ncbi:hypothetical protein Tco_0952207 [Tanacetum coccineum]|uniref:Uncharacterized protein n=1 Tax=Tanacetum coccineum TaxID=301880 RepID=A0ABQ5DX49_9ASTR
MHNNIMAAGLRDRPPMLALGRYAQWQSPVREIDDSLAVLERIAVETLLNMSPENKEHYQSEKEAIHLLLTRIGDEVYSTVNACNIAHDMWIAIERLQQGESLNIQDVKTNLFWEFGKFTSHNGVSMESYYSRIVKQNHDLDTMSYHKLFDVLKQYQKEVNEIRAERIAKNANPLALVAAAQQYPDTYYQAPRSHKSYAPPSKQASSTRSNTPTKHKGKEIVKPITPPSESASKEDNDLEQAQRDKDMQKNLALIAKYFKKIYKPANKTFKTSSNFRNKNVDTSPSYVKDNQIRQFRNQRTVTERRKPKRVKDYTYHKEKMLCKQAEKGVPLQAEQANWLEDMDEEIDEQELEAHYGFMAKIQEHSEQPESISNTCVVEKVDSDVIPNSPDMCDNDIQTDQNAEDERVALANLIANLTLDTEENKKILKQLKKANASLTQELKECKSNLEESNTTRDSCLISLQCKHTELEKYMVFNDRTVDYDKLECKLNETLGLFAQKEIDIKECLKLKAYEILVVKEKHDELVKQSLLTKSHYEGPVKEKTKAITDLKSKEEKDIDKMISMKKTTFANPMYIKKAQSEKLCLYEITYDTSNIANSFTPNREETLTLEKESRSKLDKDLWYQIFNKRTKAKAKRTKLSMGMKRAWKTKVEGIPIFYGSTRAHLMDRAVIDQWPRLEDENTPGKLEGSPLPYK